VHRGIREIDFWELYINKIGPSRLNGFHTGYRLSGLGGDDVETTGLGKNTIAQTHQSTTKLEGQFGNAADALRAEQALKWPSRPLGELRKARRSGAPEQKPWRTAQTPAFRLRGSR